jgi:hypothetical protein
MPGVATIGLRPSLVSPESRRVGRLGDVSAKACALELLCDITPAGTAFHRHITAGTVEAGEKAPQLDPVGWRDPPTEVLASRKVDYVEGELAAVDVDSSYDSHGILLELLMKTARRLIVGAKAEVPLRPCRGGSHMPSLARVDPHRDTASS